jgi:hypothetical protein
MKRYIEQVVLPARSKLLESEVVFIGKLSLSLRQQLDAELHCASLCSHDLFVYLRDSNISVIHGICSKAIDTMSLARGDLTFFSGHVAESMQIVTDGICEYVPVHDPVAVEPILRGTCVSEPVLWTKWIHQGHMRAVVESLTLRLIGQKFREVLLHCAMVTPQVRKYGIAFCDNLNDLQRNEGTVSDLQSDFASKYFKAGAIFEWGENV